MLASKDKSAINQLNLEGETALHVACDNDKPDHAECLLRWGALTDLTHSYRYPIHSALKVNSLKLVSVRWSIIFVAVNSTFLLNCIIACQCRDT